MKCKLRSIILVFFDTILVNMGIVVAYLLRFDGQLQNVLPENIYYAAIAATVIKIAFFAHFKLYSSLWRYAGIYEAAAIVKAAFAGNVIMLCYILIFQASMPKSIFAITFFIDVVLIGGMRLAYRIVRRIIKRELVKAENAKRIMIIGGGEAGAAIVKELVMHPELERVPIAIIDDDRSKIGRKINGITIVGDRKDIVDTADEKEIDEIIIAIPSVGGKVINEIYNECSRTCCKVKILPGISQMIDESEVIQKIRDVNIEDLLGREPVKIDIAGISAYLENRTVLVTGGGGSIGSELCRLIAVFNPKQLIILDNYENNLYEIENELIYKYPLLNLAAVITNIRENDRLDSVFRKYRPDIVFHAAAHKHVPLMEENPIEAVRNNIFGTLNVVKCSDKYKVRKFVLISTDKAVNPTSIMGATKRISEMIVQSLNRHSNTSFAVVRFGNVLGSSGSVIPLFKKQIEQGGPVTVTHPDVSRFFMTIPEAVQLVIEAGAMVRGGEIFVLDMGKPVRIYDLALKLIKLYGFEPYADIKIEITGLRPGEKLHEELMLEDEKLARTSNDKIYTAQPVWLDEEKLESVVDSLRDIDVNNTEEIGCLIRSIVPSYKKSGKFNNIE